MTRTSERRRLAALVRARRGALGIAQLELGLRAGLATHTVAEIETGKSRRPTIRTLARLAGALGVPVEDLARLLPNEEHVRQARARR